MHCVVLWVWGATEGELTGQNLEDTGDEETSAFLQSEELAEEEEEREAAEDDGEDHQSLDRLDPLCGGGESFVSRCPTIITIIIIRSMHTGPRRWVQAGCVMDPSQ